MGSAPNDISNFANLDIVNYDYALIAENAMFSNLSNGLVRLNSLGIELEYLDTNVLDVFGDNMAKACKLSRSRDARVGLGYGIKLGFRALSCTNPDWMGEFIYSDIKDSVNDKTSGRQLGKFIRSICVAQHDTSTLHPELNNFYPPIVEALAEKGATEKTRQYLVASFFQTTTIFDFCWDEKLKSDL
jgi:hypothetical protein